MCIHIGEYATNEEVIRTAGIEQLQLSKPLLQQGEGKWLATSSDCREKDQPIHLCTGCQKTAEERGRGGAKKTW